MPSASGKRQKNVTDIQYIPFSAHGNAEDNPTWEQELYQLYKLAMPTIVATCSQQLMIVTNQVFIGHIGTQYMAAAAIGNTIYNLMWFFLLGASTALDTLGSQAYGAGDFTGLLTWTLMCFIALTFTCIPVSAGLWFAKEICVNLFFQPDEIAELAGEFCRWLIPGLFPMVWGLILMKYMQMQNAMMLPAFAAIATCIFNAAVNYLMISHYGFLGAPQATSISRCVQCVLMLGFALGLHTGRAGTVKVWFTRRWYAPMRTAMLFCSDPRVASTFLKISIPGGFMTGLEAGSFDITTALAGMIGPVATAAHSAMLNLCNLTFISLPFAIGTATAIRVGNLLGAGNAVRAQVFSRVSVVSGAACMAVTGVLFYVYRDSLGLVFTSDPQLVAMVAGIAPFAALFQVTDGMLGPTQGVMRGMGRQHLLALYVLIGFWGFGVAMGWYLAFRGGYGLHGLWIGLVSGNFASASLNLVTVTCSDWHREVRVARERSLVRRDAGGGEGVAVIMAAASVVSAGEASDLYRHLMSDFGDDSFHNPEAELRRRWHEQRMALHHALLQRSVVTSLYSNPAGAPLEAGSPSTSLLQGDSSQFRMARNFYINTNNNPYAVANDVEETEGA